MRILGKSRPPLILPIASHAHFSTRAPASLAHTHPPPILVPPLPLHSISSPAAPLFPRCPSASTNRNLSRNTPPALLGRRHAEHECVREMRSRPVRPNQLAFVRTLDPAGTLVAPPSASTVSSSRPRLLGGGEIITTMASSRRRNKEGRVFFCAGDGVRGDRATVSC